MLCLHLHTPWIKQLQFALIQWYVMKFNVTTFFFVCLWGKWRVMNWFVCCYHHQLRLVGKSRVWRVNIRWEAAQVAVFANNVDSECLLLIFLFLLLLILPTLYCLKLLFWNELRCVMNDGNNYKLSKCFALWDWTVSISFIRHGEETDSFSENMTHLDLRRTSETRVHCGLVEPHSDFVM